MYPWIVRTLIGVSALIAISLISLDAVAAGGVNPPPPLPSTCKATGFGTECSGSMVFHDRGRPSGISCGSFDVLITGDPEVTFRGFYDQSGNLTRGHIRIHGHGVLTNSVTGAALPFLGDGSDWVDLAVPGDLSTATETFSGPGFKVTAPGRGVVFLQTGRRVFEPNGDIIVHGPNTGSAELCAALS
jgi:hypothetical protein